MPQERPWLGIVGGCGPVATTNMQRTFQDRIDVTVEQDHVPVVSCVDSTMPSRVESINGTGVPVAEVASHFEENAKYLDARCDYLLIASNTSHYFYDVVDAATEAEVLHLPRIALSRLADRYDEVVVFGTDTLEDQGIYTEAAAEYDIDVVHANSSYATDIIFMVKNDEPRERVWDVYSEWLREYESESPFLAACTEFSILDTPATITMYDAVELVVDYYVETIARRP